MGGFLVGFITLLGASIALMNIMMVSVTERTREIGIRKALGATARQIRQQFLIEAIVICVMGGMLGILLGVGGGNLLTLFVEQGALHCAVALDVAGPGYLRHRGPGLGLLSGQQSRRPRSGRLP